MADNNHPDLPAGPNSEQKPGQPGATKERRRITRRKVKVKKIFASQITIDGEEHNCFVHIHDISEGGMRLHTDFSLPLNEPIKMSVQLDEKLTVDMQAVWEKQLVGGMHVIGIRFMDLPSEEQGKINRFVANYSPENKRQSFRLERILVVEMMLGSSKQKFGVFTLDLSTTGMRINHDFPLPEDVTIQFSIQFEYDQPAIDIGAEVQWQEKNAFDQYLIGLRFVDVDDESRRRIEDFIEESQTQADSKEQGINASQSFGQLPEDAFSDL